MNVSWDFCPRRRDACSVLFFLAPQLPLPAGVETRDVHFRTIVQMQIAVTVCSKSKQLLFLALICTASHQTRDTHPTLFQCWHIVFDAGSTLKQHMVFAGTRSVPHNMALLHSGCYSPPGISPSSSISFLGSDSSICFHYNAHREGTK